MIKPFIPYAGIEFDIVNKTAKINAVEFCSKLDNDVEHEFEETDIIDLAVASVLNYQGLIETVHFIGSSFDGIMEYQLVQDVIVAFACRQNRPTKIGFDLHDDIEELKKLSLFIQRHCYVQTWELFFNPEDIPSIIFEVFKPFYVMRRNVNVFVISRRGEISSPENEEANALFGLALADFVDDSIEHGYNMRFKHLYTTKEN